MKVHKGLDKMPENVHDTVMQNTTESQPRYVVRAGGPTFTTAYAHSWLVIDRERQDVIVAEFDDPARADDRAARLNAVDEYLRHVA